MDSPLHMLTEFSELATSSLVLILQSSIGDKKIWKTEFCN